MVFKSHPSWVCGLKLIIFSKYYIVETVTPFVGVWIETLRLCISLSRLQVTPFVGVWIETRHRIRL